LSQDAVVGQVAFTNAPATLPRRISGNVAMMSALGERVSGSLSGTVRASAIDKVRLRFRSSAPGAIG